MRACVRACVRARACAGALQTTYPTHLAMLFCIPACSARTRSTGKGAPAVRAAPFSPFLGCVQGRMRITDCQSPVLIAARRQATPAACLWHSWGPSPQHGVHPACSRRQTPKHDHGAVRSWFVRHWFLSIPAGAHPDAVACRVGDVQRVQHPLVRGGAVVCCRLLAWALNPKPGQGCVGWLLVGSLAEVTPRVIPNLTHFPPSKSTKPPTQQNLHRRSQVVRVEALLRGWRVSSVGLD